MKKARVILLLSSFLFLVGMGITLTGCGGESGDDVPPMPGVPDDPNYADKSGG